jgi:nuclear pore complex protein Nup85
LCADVRFNLPLRDYLLIEYVDHLQSCSYNGSTPLWRTICGYLSAAGPEGRNRLREHILHVSLRLETTPPQSDEGMEVERDDPFAHFKAIKEVCEELGLDEQWKTISRIIADSLIRRGEYGVASTMCVQGGDGATLSRISEVILEAYIHKGEPLHGHR